MALSLHKMSRKLNELYYLFVTTNKERSTLEISTTGDLTGKIRQLEYDAEKDKPYICSKLLYWEVFNDIEEAIDREKDMKSWTIQKLTQIIDIENPYWVSLNEEVSTL
jgi:putative endonuclease